MLGEALLPPANGRLGPVALHALRSDSALVLVLNLQDCVRQVRWELRDRIVRWPNYAPVERVESPSTRQRQMPQRHRLDRPFTLTHAHDRRSFCNWFFIIL